VVDGDGNCHPRDSHAGSGRAVSSAAVLRAPPGQLSVPPRPSLLDAVGNLRDSLHRPARDTVLLPSRERGVATGSLCSLITGCVPSGAEPHPPADRGLGVARRRAVDRERSPHGGSTTKVAGGNRSSPPSPRIGAGREARFGEFSRFGDRVVTVVCAHGDYVPGGEPMWSIAGASNNAR
jgi:hypothetical protein